MSSFDEELYAGYCSECDELVAWGAEETLVCGAVVHEIDCLHEHAKYCDVCHDFYGFNAYEDTMNDSTMIVPTWIRNRALEKASEMTNGFDLDSWPEDDWACLPSTFYSDGNVRDGWDINVWCDHENGEYYVTLYEVAYGNTNTRQSLSLLEVRRDT